MDGHPGRSFKVILCALIIMIMILFVSLVAPEPYNNILFQISAFFVGVILYFRSKKEWNKWKTLTTNFKNQNWGGKVD